MDSISNSYRDIIPLMVLAISCAVLAHKGMSPLGRWKYVIPIIFILDPTFYLAVVIQGLLESQ